MRRLLPLLLLFPTAAHSQCICLSAGGSRMLPPYYHQYVSRSSGAASLSLRFPVGECFEFGPCVSITRWAVRTTDTGPYASDITYGSPVFSYGVVANGCISAGRGTVLVGHYLGLAFSKQARSGTAQRYPKGAGLDVGANLGYRYRLHKRLELSLELLPRYALIAFDSRNTNLSGDSFALFYLSAQLGIACRL